MERLTEYEPNGYVRVKRTRTLFRAEERWASPMSSAIVRLAAYEDAEEDGLLLKLFVPYGTEIFYIDQSIGYGLHGVKHYGKPFVAKKKYLWDVIFEWDKSKALYKTKEEAEAALAAMEGRKDG